MSTPHPFLTELLQQLPAVWHDPVTALADATLQTANPLRLILVGAFSVGKSSLLNMLLQESLLQSAMEETTALPTFIEYGVQREMQLIGPDGSTLPLDEAGFANATTQAPVGAACAVLALPQIWLKGVLIVDLPGLGSVSSTHRDYTLAQIQQADAVLYLVGPIGPSQTDLDMLKQIHDAGKRVKIMIARWDLIEEAVARGEKMPSLEQWSAQIEAATGLRMRLAACHKAGLGRDEAIDFVQRCREDLDTIRLRRFRVELQPILQNALGQNADSQRSCEVDSEQASRELHQELMLRKQKLTEFKASLYAEQQQDRERIERECGALLQAHRQKLARQLGEQAEQLTDEPQWPAFSQHGGDLLRAAAQEVARAFSGMSANYGALALPEAQVIELNLRLPEPEEVSAQDFLDVGKLSQLQHELKSHQAEFEAIENKLVTLDVADMSQHEQALSDLLLQRNQLAAQPLPMVIQRVGNGNGALIGRILGEVADIGLMFVNPAAAGAKVAALAGKGAKMAGVAVKTAQVAKTVKTGVKVAQALHSGQQKVSGVPQPVMNKLSGLEMLSMGYWGERIGLMFDGPSEIEVVDPQAVAEQHAALSELDKQSNNLRRALARNEDIANERQLSGWALEQNRKEQARLQAELQRLNAQAEQKQREALQNQQEERQLQLKRQAERAVAHWLRSFEQQTTAMNDLIHAQVKSYWQDRVEATVNDRLQEIEQLKAQTQSSADDKQALLARLREEAQAIVSTLATLH